MRLHHGRRAMFAVACLLALVGSMLPAHAAQAVFDDADSQRALALLNAQSCARPEMVAQASSTSPPAPTPTPSPGASASPLVPIPINGGPLYATPFPSGTAVTPPPIPTMTPMPSSSPGPDYLIRSSAPPSIAPAEPYSVQPTASPQAVPTLKPGYIAVMADKITGSTKPGIPGDATGNVHIFYQDEVLVGDRAHYDGIKTITVSGHPYIINNTKNSILYADRIVFDTIAQTATLVNGRGESSQGVEHGLVYFSAVNMQSDEHGVAHGHDASMTTCERARSGYHVTGRTIDVYPGDRIVISKAILWLGAAAVFFLPRVVIPLRTVSDERQRPQFFPELGYNAYQGFYVRARLSFGHDQYYYGYYTIEFYTKQGLTLGYNGQIATKNGRRVTNIDVQRVENHIQGATQYNASLQDQENFSQTVRGLLSYSYNGSYGPLVNLPPNQTLNAAVTHSHGFDTQSYTYSQNSTGSQASSRNIGFSDSRSLGLTLQNNFTANLSRSQSTYGGFFSENDNGTVDDLLHWASRAVDYQLNYDKTFSKTPYGINKEPELQMRPLSFLPHFAFPVAPSLTIGYYNEPATPETTARADLGVDMGPWLYHFLNNDFSATLNVHQYAYGTGDMKASVQQMYALNSPIGRHVLNNISYNEQNYNGPGAVPFSTLDLQNSQNVKNATDIIRFFNGDYYNLSLSFATQFDRLAQPVSYQLTMRPSSRSYAQFSGTFMPGPGLGFFSTNVQFSTPFGRGAWLAFLGDVDWKNKAAIINKSIYYSRIIGDCYEVQLQYNQNARAINVTAFLLAFPSHAASFGIPTNGSIIPTSFNGYGFGNP